MADEYVVFGKDTPARTVTDVGDAKVLNTTEGTANFSSDWRPWAYSAGGAILLYMLANALTGGDEIGKDGKKKKKGWLKAIAPYLAAAGGALGGYALSGAGAGGGKGQKGEYAIKKNKDGTISKVDMPSGGTAGYAAAGTLGAGAVGSGTRGVLNYRYHVSQRSQNALKALALRDKLNEAEAARDAAQKELDKAIASRAGLAPGADRRTVDALDANIGAARSSWNAADNAYNKAYTDLGDSLRRYGLQKEELDNIGEDVLKRLKRQADVLNEPDRRFIRRWLNRFGKDVPSGRGFWKGTGRALFNGHGNFWATVAQIVAALGAGAYGTHKSNALADLRKSFENAGYYVN